MAAKQKVINFGAGPAKLPEQVLSEVQQEFLDYGNTGMSVVELSHRSPTYMKINEDAQRSLRDLLHIPDNYQVLFMQGGGTGMFAAVCLNLLPRSEDAPRADYLVTGTWSDKAAKEATKYCSVHRAFPTGPYTDIPPRSMWTLDPKARFVYYCANETVHGIEFPDVPDTNGVPLVCDMSSNFLSRPIDVSKFGVIFAGAQKNIGPSGVTVVIVREDLLGKAWPSCPTVLDFTIMARDKSLHNTPPTFNIYVMGKVFEWIKSLGGVEKMEHLALDKSLLIYDVIRQSNGFYSSPVSSRVRSRMNIPFRVGSVEGVESLEKEFLAGAEKLGMLQLKGHRMVGGIRASLYNAITYEETKQLADYMVEFSKKHLK